MNSHVYNRGSLGGEEGPPPSTFTAGSGRKEFDFSGILATAHTVLGLAQGHFSCMNTLQETADAGMALE